MAEVYKINGVNVSDLLSSVQVLDGWTAVPPMRQSDTPVPGRVGDAATNPWPGARPASVGGLIAGSSRAATLTKLRRFMSVAYNGGKPMTLSKTLPLTATSDFTATTTARYTGGLDSYSEIAGNVCRAIAEFSILEAYWYGVDLIDPGVKSEATFSIDAIGEVPTHKVLVTFSGSSSTQRLTNATTGDWVQFAATTAVTPAVLDVANFTALQGATNAIQHVTSGDTNASYYWMTVAPGINTFTLTGGGSVRVAYRAAYL
jgi:hypothetical protein